MKKLLIVGMSAACIVSVSPAFGKLVQIGNTRTLTINQPAGQCKNESITLLDDRNDEYLCAITGVGGHFDGGGEQGQIIKVNGVWLLSGSSCQPGVFFQATCWGSQ